MKKITENSLRRRLKRRILSQRHQYFAVCVPGFEHVLRLEVSKLPGVEDTWTTRGGVGFSGSLDTVYAANMLLNTAHRLLLRIKEFSAHNFPMLFDQMTRVEWELWIPHGGSYNFRVSTRSSTLNMRNRVVETCHDAVQSRLAESGLTARREVDAPMVFVIRLQDNKATVSLDTSGDHLHKRGYKPFTVTAPIRETLACALLIHSRFYNYDLIVDPFCGSGTFLIEGARMSAGRPPGYARSFGFGDALFYKEGKLDRLRSATNETFMSSTKYFGYDISEEAVRTSQLNIQESGNKELITIQRMNFLNIDFATLGAEGHNKLLITNPPYGKRLQWGEMAETQLAELLVQRLSGWSVAIISTRNLTVSDSLRLSTRQAILGGEVIAFSNGGIETYLHRFEVN